MTQISQQHGGTAARIRQRPLVKQRLGWIVLMPLFVGTAAWGKPSTVPVALPQRESAWPQVALPGAHGSSSKPPALPSEEAAFATLGRALDVQLEAISVALGHLAAPPSHSGSLTAGSGFGEYAEGVRSIVLPRLRALVIEAGELALRAARAAEPTAQGALKKAAGARYQAAMLIAQVVRLEVDCAIVGSYADAAGVPFGAVKARLERFDAEMSPMIDAAASLDSAKMRWAAEMLLPKSEEVTAELSQAMQTIGKNEELSRKVIGTADVLLLSLALYHVGRLPVVDVNGG